MKPPAGNLVKSHATPLLPHEPQWKTATLGRLDEIKAMPDNWDGYGSPAIPAVLISKMAALINAISACELPRQVSAPTVSAASDGLQIEWNGGRGGVEIVLHFDRSVAFVLECDGKYVDGPLEITDPTPLVSLLRRVFCEPGEE